MQHRSTRRRGRTPSPRQWHHAQPKHLLGEVQLQEQIRVGHQVGTCHQVEPEALPASGTLPWRSEFGDNILGGWAEPDRSEGVAQERPSLGMLAEALVPKWFAGLRERASIEPAGEDFP